MGSTFIAALRAADRPAGGRPFPVVPVAASPLLVQGPVGSITALPEGVKPTAVSAPPPLWPSPPRRTMISCTRSWRPAQGVHHAVSRVPARAGSAPKASLGVTGSAGPDYHGGKPALPPRDLPPRKPGGGSVPSANLSRVWPTMRSAAPASSSSSIASGPGASTCRHGVPVATRSASTCSQTRSLRTTPHRHTPPQAAPRPTSKSGKPPARANATADARDHAKRGSKIAWVGSRSSPRSSLRPPTRAQSRQSPILATTSALHPATRGYAIRTPAMRIRRRGGAD